MDFIINKEEYEYLSSFLPESLREQVTQAAIGRGNTTILKLSKDVADRLRDICGEQLQVKGFDQNYSLTTQGKILESLIDKLLVRK